MAGQLKKFHIRVFVGNCTNDVFMVDLIHSSKARQK